MVHCGGSLLSAVTTTARRGTSSSRRSSCLTRGGRHLPSFVPPVTPGVFIRSGPLGPPDPVVVSVSQLSLTDSILSRKGFDDNLQVPFSLCVSLREIRDRS